MSVSPIAVRRPQRWDHPFDPEMRDADVQWILQQAPFSRMDQGRFPKSASLSDILRNDSRLVRFEHGDLILREGDYGSSAFLVLGGQVRVFVSKLSPELLGRSEQKKLTWWQALHRIRRRSEVAEVRELSQQEPIQFARSGTSLRDAHGEKHVFIQDVDRLLSTHQTTVVAPGEIFGELSAINRTPRPFSCIADGPAALLEIRWQGLRLMRRDPGFREYLDHLYRETSLLSHLRETPILRFLGEEQLADVAASIQFESYGDFEWFSEFEESQQLDIQQKVSQEPLIAEEGTPADYLCLIRSGFSRLSVRQGAGHRTIAYLGRGKLFGLDEIAENLRRVTDDNPLPYQQSLRAVGYVDILKIPKDVVMLKILPFVREAEMPPRITAPRYVPGKPLLDVRLDEESAPVDTGLLEFLVDQRLVNGRQAMLIDTHRCTRCDDCVKACAATHDGNPRFLRDGPQFGPYLFPHACMHCEDPVCMIGCPTGAISREQSNGTVSINPNTCIGCKTCSESCPYDNIKMVEVRDRQGRKLVDEKVGLPILQATKCDLCQTMPSGPACQIACPHDALVRLNIGDLQQLKRWIDRRAA